MDLELEKALLKVIHHVSAHFGPQAVVKGGMSLRLQGIPRSTVDVDYSFQPFKRKTPFSAELVRVVGEICDGETEQHSDSKKLQIKGRIDGVEILVEASPHAAFEPTAIPTSALAGKLSLPPSIVSIMPNNISFAHKLGAWLDRRLVRDIYDVYVFYEILRSKPDPEVLMKRITRPNFARGIAIRPNLDSIEAFERFLKERVAEMPPEEIDLRMQGLVEERERIGLGMLIRTTILRMRLQS